MALSCCALRALFYECLDPAERKPGTGDPTGATRHGAGRTGGDSGRPGEGDEAGSCDGTGGRTVAVAKLHVEAPGSVACTQDSACATRASRACVHRAGSSSGGLGAGRVATCRRPFSANSRRCVSARSRFISLVSSRERRQRPLALRVANCPLIGMLVGGSQSHPLPRSRWTRYFTDLEANFPYGPILVVLTVTFSTKVCVGCDVLDNEKCRGLGLKGLPGFWLLRWLSAGWPGRGLGRGRTERGWAARLVGRAGGPAGLGLGEGEG
jgi:hypothetical protein